MTEKIKIMLDFLKSKEYKTKRGERISVTENDLKDLNTYAKTFRNLAENEKPIIFDNNSFGFNRSTKTKFSYSCGNITPNYARIITDGFDKTISDIKVAISSEKDNSKKEYGKIMIDMLESALIIADNYREEAKIRKKR